MSSTHMLSFGNNQNNKKKKSGEWCQTVEDLHNESDVKPTNPEEELVYVNLPDNRESYTAYNGSQIWNAIYGENCLLDRVSRQGIDTKDTCSEETLLY